MKNKKDREIFEKSYRLAYMVTRGMKNGHIERDEIDQYFEERESTDQFLSDLSSEENFKNRTTLIEQSFENRNTEKLLSRIYSYERRKIRRKIYLIVGSAAAALVAISFYLMGNIDQDNTIVAINNSVGQKQIIKPTIIVNSEKYIELNTQENIISVNDNIRDTTITENRELELVVPAGYIYSVKLSDGSVATLNAGSTMKYSEYFEGDTREVEIYGEGYFKVTKSDKPFIISTKVGSIRVYGTEFNVKSYGTTMLETVLVRGSVGVTVNTLKEVMMTPSQMVSFNGESGKIDLKNVDTDKYTQWMENNFNYDNYPLKRVLNDISLWYNTPIEYSKNINNINVTFFSSRKADIREILDIIELGANVKFRKGEGGCYRVEK